MFGLSFGELLVLTVVALVVIGPRELPTMMRTLGRSIGKLKRMATEVCVDSGIDTILHQEGIHREIHNFKRLVSGEIIDDDDLDGVPRPILPDRAREYPLMGADGDGVVSEEESLYLEPLAEQAPQAPALAEPAAVPTAPPSGQATPEFDLAAALPAPAAPPPPPDEAKAAES